MSDTPENTMQAMEIAELETERLPLSEVTPHPDNPRIHSPEQIKTIRGNDRLSNSLGDRTLWEQITRLVKVV